MEKRKIGKLEVSAVGLGCMGITHASGAPMSIKDGVRVSGRRCCMNWQRKSRQRLHRFLWHGCCAKSRLSF